MDFLSINGHEIKWCLHCWNSAFTRWIWFEREREREREFIWFFNKVNTICKRVALCKCETLFSIARCEIQKNSRTKEGWKSYTNIHFYFASISSFAKQKRGWKQNERKKRKKMAKIHIPARLRLWCTTSVRLQSHCWLVGSLRCDAGFHFEELMGDVERENASEHDEPETRTTLLVVLLLDRGPTLTHPGYHYARSTDPPRLDSSTASFALSFPLQPRTHVEIQTRDKPRAVKGATSVYCDGPCRGPFSSFSLPLSQSLSSPTCYDINRFLPRLWYKISLSIFRFVRSLSLFCKPRRTVIALSLHERRKLVYVSREISPGRKSIADTRLHNVTSSSLVGIGRKRVTVSVSSLSAGREREREEGGGR